MPLNKESKPIKTEIYQYQVMVKNGYISDADFPNKQTFFI